MRETAQFNYDNLLASTTFPVVTDTVTIAPNQTLLRGQVIVLGETGAVAAEELSDLTKVHGILAEDIVVGTEEKQATIFLTGEFNSRKVILPVSKLADYKTALRKIGIFLKDTIQA